MHNQFLSGGNEVEPPVSSRSQGRCGDFNRASVRSNATRESELEGKNDALLVRKLNDIFGRGTGTVQEWARGRIA